MDVRGIYGGLMMTVCDGNKWLMMATNNGIVLYCCWFMMVHKLLVNNNDELLADDSYDELLTTYDGCWYVLILVNI